jgi:DnaJ-class molecular chaperone
LSDPEKRELYDQGGEEAVADGGAGGGGGAAGMDLFVSRTQHRLSSNSRNERAGAGLPQRGLRWIAGGDLLLSLLVAPGRSNNVLIV